jgi:hypothetical protein
VTRRWYYWRRPSPGRRLKNPYHEVPLQVFSASLRTQSIRLAMLMQAFDCSAAEVIRQLIVQAQPEDFPESWHLAVRERRDHPSR